MSTTTSTSNTLLDYIKDENGKSIKHMFPNFSNDQLLHEVSMLKGVEESPLTVCLCLELGKRLAQAEAEIDTLRNSLHRRY